MYFTFLMNYYLNHFPLEIINSFQISISTDHNEKKIKIKKKKVLLFTVHKIYSVKFIDIVDHFYVYNKKFII